jgi:membrane-bound ClpP family serine protease
MHLPAIATNIIGVIGACCILLGFYRTSIGKWTGKSLWYELDNFVGATLLVIYQLSVGAYISVTLNIIWAVVALRGITSIAQRRDWVKLPKNFFKN